jgi:hypothetical protein
MELAKLCQLIYDLIPSSADVMIEFVEVLL